MSEHHPSDDKDLPLRDDIRLLGRVLGDTVREQEGEDIFAAVERIRQTSVALNQNPARELDPAARAELEAVLDELPRDTMISVVRAFSYFLHLANIAEDQHHIRRRRVHGNGRRKSAFAGRVRPRGPQKERRAALRRHGKARFHRPRHADKR